LEVVQGNVIQGNFIGTDVTGAQALGNQGAGVVVNDDANTIGGTVAGAGNIIAFNDGGVLIGQRLFDGKAAVANAILGNAIFANTCKSISLGSPPCTAIPNDGGDSDTGANNLQNFPVFTTVSTDGGTTVVAGALNSTPNTAFRVEFFSNTVCDPSGFGAGEQFLGSTPVTTDGQGNASFQATFPAPLAVGQFLTATATDPNNNTSEFSQCLALSPGTGQTPDGGQTPSTAIVAAVLPSSRSVQVGTPATAFATIINVGSTTVTGCGLSPTTNVPASFVFQTTNPSTNQVTGFPNTPVDIPAGVAQSFVFAFTPTAPITQIEVALHFGCVNSAPAPSIVGLNTLLLSAAATPIPDIVALAATLNNDGIVNIPGTTGTGVFSVATVNVGAPGALTVSADTGSTTLPVNIALCETNPTSGQCLAALTDSVTTQIDANETPTFGIFATGTGNVAFDPAANRIFVRFKDADGATRGSTSVAVKTQ
jgi:hypothetical protein